MPSALVLAVDVGSTWCKAAYIDRQGQIVATGRAYTRAIASARTTTLPAFWQAFVDAVRAATNALSTPIPPAAIGFSSRALFGVCLDQAGAWFMPAWDAQMDRRTSPELQHAYSPAIWGAQDPFAFGYGVSVGGMLYWLKRTRPAEWRTIRRVGALHDYLLYQLTDSWVTNPATGPGEAGWPAQIPLLADLPPAAFPPVWQPHELAGELTPAAAQLLALPAGIPVVVGAHDGAAANLGLGAIAPNDGCLNL
ncbi:MAG: hypothetical protein KDE47_32655, partial [Caldilineaceae bacterium]|nr:hypothetical protein [Caldilineaceae bacterium]